MIYGTPAAGLTRGGFGTDATRSAGAAGERLTAAVLDGFAGRAAIFHDLNIPRTPYNIDHAVLAGNRLLLIDSKMWKAGRYWSIGGHYYRGLERREPPSGNVFLAYDTFAESLPHCHFYTPLVVLWSGAQRNAPMAVTPRSLGPIGVPMQPERTARPFLHFAYPGARTITGNDLYARIDRLTRRAGKPNQAVISYLTRYLTR